MNMIAENFEDHLNSTFIFVSGLKTEEMEYWSVVKLFA